MLDKPSKPDDIPNAPQIVFSESWISIGDWVGVGHPIRPTRNWLPFEEARDYVRELKLENVGEWKKYCKGELADKPPRPHDIPSNPNRAYKDDWSGWGDWLNTDVIAPRDRVYRPFRESRAFVRQLRLQSWADWTKYCKGEMLDKPSKPDDIPAASYHVYKDNWISTGDWLGTGRHKGNWMPFEEARTFVRELGLQSWADWTKYCKGEMLDKPSKPHDIPSNPNAFYRDNGWVSLVDWLGK